MTRLLFAAVLATNITWHDVARDRDVPVRIYAPEKITAPVPLIVFSHGLGGTREGYAYLGQHWASNGFICVHVQHLGSDDAVWRGSTNKLTAMRRAVATPENWHDRPHDVSFAITQMLRDPRVNTNAIGVAGHSFGAHTTLEIVGMRVAGESFRDPRVKAAISMSSPRPPSGQVFSDIATPCLHLTGTKDDSLIVNTTAKDRRFAFDHIAGPGQWLITLKDANHMTFAGLGDAKHHELIRQITTTFWNAFLKDDVKAKSWLTGEGLEKLVGSDATVEHK
jgi:predicted dienelactone hydrolase